MSTFDPEAFPYVRAQNYVDDNPPDVLADEFFNPVQDSLARLFGGMGGVSTSVVWDEFDRPFATASPGASGDLFGSDFALTAAALNCQGQSVGTSASGHGQAKATPIVNGSFNLAAADTYSLIGANRLFIQTARLIVIGRARLSTIANSGMVCGLGTLASNLPIFILGSDQPNWYTSYAGSTVDSGVAQVDGDWVDLIIARKDGSIRWYIQPEGGAMTLVRTEAAAGALVDTRRYLRVGDDTGSAVLNDGLYIDFYGRIIER